MRAPPFVIESPSPTEQRVSFRVGDSWCRATEYGLRCGARMSTTSLELAAGFAFETLQPAAEVELVVSRGSSLTIRAPDGRRLDRGGSGLQVSQVGRVTPVEVSVEGDTQLACVAVSLSRARLAELLGSATLPPVLLGAEPEAGGLRAMTPQLSRVLEEILNVDARSSSRALWLDAKCQELIALATDQLAEAVIPPRVTASELARLERVRRRLEQHLERTPTLAELAKLSGFGETKLKVAFRETFGESIFGYLRRARLEEARRLLSTRRLNVAEVATRVGYENPSKFAAAFRREFQLSPSEAPRRAG